MVRKSAMLDTRRDFRAVFVSRISRRSGGWRGAMAAFIAVLLALKKGIRVMSLGGRPFGLSFVRRAARPLSIVRCAGGLEEIMRHADLVYLSRRLIEYTDRGLCLRKPESVYLMNTLRLRLIYHLTTTRLCITASSTRLVYIWREVSHVQRPRATPLQPWQLVWRSSFAFSSRDEMKTPTGSPQFR